MDEDKEYSRRDFLGIFSVRSGRDEVTRARGGDEAAPPTAESAELNRRNLFRKGIHYLARPMVESVGEKIGNINRVLSQATRRVALLRPPGALAEEKFLELCTRCGKCVNACPRGAIVFAPKSFGSSVAGTPFVNPAKSPCVMCDTLPCIPACPDGALLPVPGGRTAVRMGLASVDESRCHAPAVACQDCVSACPIPGAIRLLDGKPIIDKQVCTGCGVCAHVCTAVTNPAAMRIRPGMVLESA